MNLFIALAAAYLLGSLPSAYLMARWRRNTDIRRVGSRNMGAMNVLYSVGVWEGFTVLIVDFAKGFLAVFIARWLGESLTVQMACGAVAILGHMAPVFLGFTSIKALTRIPLSLRSLAHARPSVVAPQSTTLRRDLRKPGII